MSCDKELKRVKKALVLVADGCEEIETVTIIDLLRRSITRVTVAGLNKEVVTGSRRIQFVPNSRSPGIPAESVSQLLCGHGNGRRQSQRQFCSRLQNWG